MVALVINFTCQECDFYVPIILLPLLPRQPPLLSRKPFNGHQRPPIRDDESRPVILGVHLVYLVYGMYLSSPVWKDGRLADG